MTISKFDSELLTENIIKYFPIGSSIAAVFLSTGSLWVDISGHQSFTELGIPSYKIVCLFFLLSSIVGLIFTISIFYIAQLFSIEEADNFRIIESFESCKISFINNKATYIRSLKIKTKKDLQAIYTQLPSITNNQPAINESVMVKNLLGNWENKQVVINEVADRKYLYCLMDLKKGKTIEVKYQWDVTQAFQKNDSIAIVFLPNMEKCNLKIEFIDNNIIQKANFFINKGHLPFTVDEGIVQFNSNSMENEFSKKEYKCPLRCSIKWEVI